jgi:hypothetical protein
MVNLHFSKCAMADKYDIEVKLLAVTPDAEKLRTNQRGGELNRDKQDSWFVEKKNAHKI